MIRGSIIRNRKKLILFLCFVVESRLTRGKICKENREVKKYARNTSVGMSSLRTSAREVLPFKQELCAKRRKNNKIEIKYLRVSTSTIGYLLSFLYLAFYSIAQNIP